MTDPQQDFEDRAYTLADKLATLAAAGTVFLSGVNRALREAREVLERLEAEKKRNL